MPTLQPGEILGARDLQDEAAIEGVGDSSLIHLCVRPPSPRAAVAAFGSQSSRRKLPRSIRYFCGIECVRVCVHARARVCAVVHCFSLQTCILVLSLKLHKDSLWVCVLISTEIPEAGASPSPAWVWCVIAHGGSCHSRLGHSLFLVCEKCRLNHISFFLSTL